MLSDFKAAQLLVVPGSLLPSRHTFMGYSRKLLVAACDHLFHSVAPPSSSRKKGKETETAFSFCQLSFERQGKNRQAKQTQHIIIIALHALLLTAQKKHIWGKTL